MPIQKKREVITFKVDESLSEAMQGMQNRSEFIRRAILAALDGVCPLCKGAGVLTPKQRVHWEAFSTDHSLAECTDCHAIHLVCLAAKDESTH
ncbi:hypothetical protein AMJ39_05940 [candidate division TA06 bacterium DG_24]|uniref:CopG family transcriptional regulator n=3 Tax=Bacteria division TA06 TaxID=1156500 RepID=A0A0S8JKA5_UNCT6|nr:MAG: hypothetical protein AMJ39_05940 [candidate division TA06 bacterium DG_24]KPK70246.1 MAG: hypothetical protein AMJ82_03680 [candidate division TA06 bacterium SM23_40]KPL09070.1 MAG: hypothetical protein AMJ71_07410 [candidate division TA06 bacterium SM1_40]